MAILRIRARRARKHFHLAKVGTAVGYECLKYDTNRYAFRNRLYICVDELSLESGGNASPKLRSKSRSNASSSNNCSRNNSPRMKDIGEARLRPGANARTSNRNSANLTSSTLQQDLMKLINPDYTADDNVGFFLCVCVRDRFYSVQNNYSFFPPLNDDSKIAKKILVLLKFQSLRSKWKIFALIPRTKI